MHCIKSNQTDLNYMWHTTTHFLESRKSINLNGNYKVHSNDVDCLVFKTDNYVSLIKYQKDN